MATQASDSLKQRPRTTIADELAVVVQRAQAFTNASGAAIATGNAEELVCRARSGSSAPEVGTAMRVEGSFTGICIHTGKELRCDDAETDTRVDTAALRSLGIRSLVVTPIKDEGKVIGVLAVFAPTPHAFTITHVAVLKTMADQISALLQKERRSPREESHVESSVAPPPRAAAAPTPLPPVVIRPAGSSGTVGTAAAPARTNGSGAPVAEPLRPVAIATEIVPVPFPKREEKREAKRTEQRPEPPAPPAKSSFAVLDAVGGEPHRSKSGTFVAIGAIVILAVAAVVVWMIVGRHKSNATQAQQPAQQAQTTASVPQPAAAVIPNSTPAPTTPAPTAPVATSNTKPATEKSESRKTDSQKSEKQNKPAPAAAPTTVELASGPSKITGKAAEQPANDVAPSLSVGSSSSPSLNTLAKPVGNSVPSILAQSELVNAKVIRGTPAVYPEIAKARRISGTVVVRVTVGKDGKVSNPKFVSGPMVFRDSAFDAVKQWLFKPATLNGQAIEQETEITVKFSSPS